MALEEFCLNCFSQRGSYEVCPYCGYLAGTLPQEGYYLHPGTRLWGRYIIGTVLGAGGFGITYKAWDTRLNTVVAIKEFFPQNLVSRIPGESKVRVFSGDKQQSYQHQLGRFMEEAKNLAVFTGDEHIVNVYDSFEDNSTAYIVMEFLDGTTLKEYMALQGGRLPSQQVMDISTALLKALSVIHKKGIIHRDISPDNIFILRSGSMKILDFGAARFEAQQSGELTQGVVVKKGYAPPEQYRTNMKQGVWTDIYAAGATIYKMMTGITPEESIERTEKDVLKRPSQTGTAVDASIDKTIMKAMALRPELRFKSADAMLAALENRTMIDFPEEELKKRHKRNAVLLALSIFAVVSMALFVGWKTSQQPTVISGGPSLADVEVQPDTITILAIEKNIGTTSYEQLATAFTEKYPQYKVEVEIVPRTDTVYEEVTPRFLTPQAPTLFVSSIPKLKQKEEPYAADLSLLYNSINASEYLLMEEYAKEHLDEDTNEIYKIPLGMTCTIAYAYPNAAAQRGLDLPMAIHSYDELKQLELEMPGTVKLYQYNFAKLISVYHPEILEQKDLQKLEDFYGEYAKLCAQGYFRSNVRGEISEFDTAMLEPATFSATGIRREMESAQDTPVIIPVLVNNTLPCDDSMSMNVSCHATENQQKVAMLFLHFMLSEYGQNLLHVQNDTSLPLQKTVLNQYIAAHPEHSYLTQPLINSIYYNQKNVYIKNINPIFDNLGSQDELTPEEFEKQIRALVREQYSDWQQ